MRAWSSGMDSLYVGPSFMRQSSDAQDFFCGQAACPPPHHAARVTSHRRSPPRNRDL
jgi:hypothetical protein